MARRSRASAEPLSTNSDTEFANDLIKSINKDVKGTDAYNLNDDSNPTNIKRYISTGSVLLDYIISNRRNGGIAEGRLTEITGEESTGKSFIGYQILAQTQKIDGISVYIDTENATDKNLLKTLGINIDKLVYLQPESIESVFKSIEHIIKKIKETGLKKPVTIVWDSVAATSPQAELDGDFDANTVGLGARIVSKALRKIMKIIGDERITLVFINQLKMKIGAGIYEDPWVAPYGKAIPFHASTRLRVTRKRSSDTKDSDDIGADYLGIGVKAKVVKNKICPPFRSCEFTIAFYNGVQEFNQIYDAIKDASPVEFEFDGKKCQMTVTSGQWHKVNLLKEDGTEILPEFNFRKTEIEERVFKNELLKPYLDEVIDVILKRVYTEQELPEYYDEVLSDEVLSEISV